MSHLTYTLNVNIELRSTGSFLLGFIVAVVLLGTKSTQFGNWLK